jgi:hypothetical protein
LFIELIRVIGDVNHEKICETLEDRKERAQYLITQVLRRDRQLAAAQAVMPPRAAPMPRSASPHPPPPPPTAAEKSDQPSYAADIWAPSPSQVTLLGEDSEEEVQTLNSSISSGSASEASSLPSPTESQFSQVSFEATQGEHLVESDEEEQGVEEGEEEPNEVEDEGLHDDSLDATHQSASISPSEPRIAILDVVTKVAESQDSRVVPLPSESVEKEASPIQPSVPLSEDSGRHGQEESEKDLEREAPGSASLAWGLALGGLAAIAFIAMKPNLRRAVTDVARKVSSIRRL